MSQIMLFNKPFSVLSQFTSEPPHRTLVEYITRKGFYAAGRLDKDSEGLLILTNDGKLQQKIYLTVITNCHCVTTSLTLFILLSDELHTQPLSIERRRFFTFYFHGDTGFDQKAIRVLAIDIQNLRVCPNTLTRSHWR